MLPFLKRKDEASASMPVESITREHDEDFDSLEVAAEDLMVAVHSKNPKAIAEALRAAFDLMDSEPHMEGPHEDGK
jgi:hypothetical protein